MAGASRKLNGVLATGGNVGTGENGFVLDSAGGMLLYTADQLTDETFELFACTRRLYDVATSLAQGAESRGMRPEAVEMMRKQMGATARVYELLAERTGIRLEGIERMIASTA